MMKTQRTDTKRSYLIEECKRKGFDKIIRKNA